MTEADIGTRSAIVKVTAETASLGNCKAENPSSAPATYCGSDLSACAAAATFGNGGEHVRLGACKFVYVCIRWQTSPSLRWNAGFHSVRAVWDGL